MDSFDSDVIYIKKKKIKHWIVVLIFLLIVLLAVNLRVKDISVLGNKTYSDDRAVELVFPDVLSRMSACIVINNVLNNKKSIPFVADYEINLIGPTSAELIIYEQNPIACVRYVSSYMYFDSDGKVLESSDFLMDGIPVVEGLEFGHIVLGEELPLANKEVFKDILNITQQMGLTETSCECIKFDSAGNISLVLDGGDIVVQLGTNEDISVKLSVMNDMLKGIREKGLKGSLNLSEYSENASGQVISFRVNQG